MLVLIKSHDPRFGETVSRLTSISLKEPDPSLIQIPSDFIVQGLQTSKSGFFKRPNNALHADLACR
jgi:hypothetical protein